ncbi:hypothetical protein CFP56_010009 [Quercus suber]|uniref:RNase H type-1 domain-containing protein n=1 Tax=Quercus suber TaxID=58331 RepID=A0AAW0L2N9_QUESU
MENPKKRLVVPYRPKEKDYLYTNPQDLSKCYTQSGSSLLHDSLGDLGTEEQIEGASACLGRWGRGLYKVNFDGAVFEDQACAGLGVVIRDLAGLIIGALSQRIRLPSSVVMGEALAARRAVLFAKEISVFRVVIEDQ